MLSTRCFAHLAILRLCSLYFRWEIITNKTTEANFTCPPDHQTTIFTCPKAKFTCPGKSDLWFMLPCSWGRKTRVPGENLRRMARTNNKPTYGTGRKKWYNGKYDYTRNRGNSSFDAINLPSIVTAWLKECKLMGKLMLINQRNTHLPPPCFDHEFPGKMRGRLWF